MPESLVLLTGFMGSGKSSVGKVVADLLGWRFIDLDAEIVAAAGCSINEIFARDGEPAFRVRESSQLEKVLTMSEGCIVATGGGVVLSAHNRSLMRSRGVVVNLKVTLEQVVARLKGCSDRPLLVGDDADKRAKALMDEREQFYADADIRIDTDGKSVEDVAAEILCRLKGFFSECTVR
ncbi:MAG: shikimate kinase [Desulfuromonadaceae bacterium]|nr:shikimate kinase [Desulfuromonadaceae bacterium]MDD2847085.1 shikimate kinase [Desulfuromonadaceae bacterium]MDD4128937.1 shikimate kinase [Desulfuromonadaceae bacterium]